MVADPGSRSGIGGRRAFFFDVLAFFLLLVAPYLNFAVHNGFVVEAANLIVFAGFLGLAVAGALVLIWVPSGFLRVLMLSGLVLVFADAQFTGGLIVLLISVAAFLGLLCLRGDHRMPVVASVFGAMIAATMVPVLMSGDVRKPALSGVSVDAANSVAPELPVYVHIVLDGQLGIDGFSDDVPAQKAVKVAALELFSKYGFRVFTQAYSAYDKTELSMSVALNAGAVTDQRNLFSSSQIPDSFKLDRNGYFDRLGALGYGINVFQSTFMDYCAGARESIVYCESYDQNAVSSESTARFTAWEKAEFVLSVYSDLLFVKRQMARIYGPVRGQLSALGIAMPQWRVLHLHRIGPMGVFPVIDRMTARVAATKRGNMFFAHLMVPHEPYAVGPSCGLRRPVLEWPSHVARTWDGDPVSSNSAQSRLYAYRAYVDQVRCTLSVIERFFATMEEAGTLRDATIVIHGDHGSRLSRINPAAENIPQLSRQDYVDSFSTLFAIKSPAISPGVDRRIASLEELMRSVGTKSVMTAAADTASSRRVYLRKGTNSGQGHRLCRIAPVSWLQANDVGFLQPLRRWSEKECTHIVAPVYKEVEKVILTETWDAVR